MKTIRSKSNARRLQGFLKKTTIMLSVLAVFLSSYLLVLPAMTLDEDTGEAEPGVDLETREVAYVTENEESSVTDSEETVVVQGIDETKQNEDEPDENINEELIENDASQLTEADPFDQDSFDTNEVDTKEDSQTDPSQEESISLPPLSFEVSLNDTLIFISSPEGALPSDTSVKAKEITDDKDIIDTISSSIQEGKTISKVKAYDISFIHNDEEIEPNLPVQVSITSTFMQEEDDDALLFHMKEEESPEQMKTKTLNEEELSSFSEDHIDIIEKHDTIEQIDNNNTLFFESDSFSVYAIVYTVDFEYSVDGKVFQYSLSGGDKITLSELIDILGIINDTSFENADAFLNEVDDVEFSDEDLVQINKIGNDWELESLDPFTSDESLTITMKNGDEIIVKVKDAQYLSDISSLLTEATLKLNGEEVQNGAELDIKENTQFELEAKFVETDDFQFSNDGTLTYKLPDGFVLPDGFEKTVTLDLGLDGKLYRNKLTYDPSTNTLTLALNKNDPNYSAFTASGTANIDLKVNGYFDFTQSHVEFSPDLAVTVTRKDPHDANVTKEGSYDKTTQTMTYTVIVTADGTVSNLNVSDHISSSALSYQNGSITVKNDERPASAGTRANPVTWTESNGGFDAVIPDMVDGEVITFEYKATVDPSKVSQSGNATFDEMGNTVTIHNDSIDKEATHVYHNIEVSDISKNAVSVSDIVEEDGKKYQNVTWEIVTNDPPEASLAGSKITDTMTGGMVGNSVYNDDVKIYVYDSNGQQVGDVREPSLSDLGNNDPQNIKTWTYNVPTTDGNYKYVIRYSTKVDVTYVTGMSTAMNNVTGKGGSATGTAPVGQNTDHPGGDEPVDDGISVSKQTLHVSEEEIQWVIPISVNAKEDGYDSFVVEDKFPAKAFNGVGYIDTLKMTGTTLKDSIEITGLNPGEDYEVEYLPSEHSNDNAYTSVGKGDLPAGIKITFYKANGKPGLVADSARVINVKLTTLNDQQWLEAALNGSDPEWNKHTNSGNVNQHRFEYTAMPMKKVIAKVLHGNYQGIDYTFIGDTQTTKEVPRYEFRVSVGGVNDEPLVINDTLDTEHFALYGNVEIAGGSHKTDPGNAKKTLTEGIDYSVRSDGIDFSVGDLPKDNGSYYGYYILTYYMIPKSKADFEQIKMEAADNNGKANYTNTAALDENNKSTVDFHYEYKILDKTATVHDGYVTYTITINKDKKELNGGEDMTLFDTYSRNQTIDFSTITVVEADPNENRNKVSWDFSGYTGTFNIPDSTKVVITYNAKPVGDTEQTLTNEVYMNGYYDDSGETKVVGGSGVGGASSLRIRVYKYESGHMESGLNGAYFRLLDANKQPILDREGKEITFSTSEVYMYSQDVPEDNEAFQELGIAGKKKDVIETSDIVIKNLDEEFAANPWSNVKQYVKKVRGYANVLLDEAVTGAYLKKDTRYYLEEYRTATEDADGNPVSYKLPTFLYSFMISDHPDYSDYIYSNNDVMTARNDRDNGGLDIVKQWGGSAELTDEQKSNIYFLIEKKNGETWEPYSHNGAYPDGHIPYSALTDDVLHLKDVPEGNYRVTEHNAEVDDYNLLTTYTVDGENVSTSKEFAFIDSDVDETPKSHNVTITNKYDVKGYEFTKIDSNTMASLPGAVFTVKKQNDNSEVKTYTSGDDGKFIIQWSEEDYVYDTLYYIEETTPPESYSISENKKFYFFFSDPAQTTETDDEKTWDKTYNAVNLTKDGGRETVKNEKGELTVTKEWKNQNGNPMSPGAESVTVTLKRYTMVYPTKKVSISIHGADNGDDNTIIYPNVYVPNGGDIQITWTDDWGAATIGNVRVNGKSLSEYGFEIVQWNDLNGYYGTEEIIKLTSITSDLELHIETGHRIKTDNGSYNAIPLGETLDGASSEEKIRLDDDDFSEECSLNASGGWSHTWTISDADGALPKVEGDIVLPKTDEQGNEYFYYVEETPIHGFTTSYVPSTGGVKTGEIQVINTGEEEEPKTGSLKIMKTVLFGDQPNGTNNLTDGTYLFEIFGEDGTSKATKADGSNIDSLSITIRGGVANPSELTVDGLTPGVYVVKETGSTNANMRMVTENISGYDSTKGGIVVNVVSGNTDSIPLASFVNNYEITMFEFTKEWHNTNDQVDDNWGGDITVILQRRIGTGNPEIVGKYSIHNNNGTFTITKDESTSQAPDLAEESGFTFKIADLPKNGKIGSENGEYTYFVTEETVDGYKNATYSNPSASAPITWTQSSDCALNGGKIINRPEDGFELPSTGGPGTQMFWILGKTMILAASVLLLKKQIFVRNK